MAEPTHPKFLAIANSVNRSNCILTSKKSGKGDRAVVAMRTQVSIKDVNCMRQIKLSLLTLTTILAASLPARTQEQLPTVTIIAQATQTDLIGAGASIINTLINPPSRSAEIAADAEIKKAKIAADAEIAKEKLRIEASKSADRVTPVLDSWGVSRIDCVPGAVFVNGIVTETVCVQPTSALTAGYYTYDRNNQQLVRTNNSERNIQTIQSVQTTRVLNSTERNTRESGF